MHLLLGEGGLAPAEIADHRRPVGKGLQGPQAHHAGGRTGVVGRPVHRAGLLLHDPEGPGGQAAGLVEEEGREIRMTGAHPGPERLRRGPGHAQVRAAQGIVVIAREVETGGQGVIVHAGLVHRDEVVGDEPARRPWPQDVQLGPVEAHHLVGREPSPGHAVGGARLRHRPHRQLDLVEAAVFHGPEHIAPGGVQGRHVAVAGLQPDPEGVPRHRRGGQGGVMAAQLVVRLPAHHAGMLAVALGQGGDDAAAGLQIGLAGEVVVPAGAEPPGPPRLRVHGQHVRMPVHQPFGRGGRRRADHHFQPRVGQDVEGVVEPAEVVVSGRRLEAGPGELPHPHIGEAERLHPAGVLGPHLARPVFGIVADPQHPRVPPRARRGRSTLPASCIL